MKKITAIVSIVFLLVSMNFEVNADIIKKGNGHSGGQATKVTLGEGIYRPNIEISDSEEKTKVQKEIIILYPGQAEPMASSIMLNGKLVQKSGYLIHDSNYMKLRDIAYMVNGTDKQFEVTFDESLNLIRLTSKKSYTPVGGENQSKGLEIKNAEPTAAKILLNQEEIQLPAYNIDDNNYFRLRDIGECFDFYVGWNEDSNTIIVDTNRSYEEN